MKHTNENGVSPVVATIMLVAICIIMAAIIAAFAFGTVGGGQKEHNIGFTSTLNNGDVIITVNSADSDALGLLDHINVKINDVDVADWKPTVVGDSTTYTGDFTKGTTIKMYGYFYPNNQAQPLYVTTL